MAKNPAAILYTTAGNAVVTDTDSMLVVDQKGNSHITGNITAVNGIVSIDTHSSAMVTVSISGTWVGTIVGEATVNGTDWFPLTGHVIDGFGVVTEAHQNGEFRANVHGFETIRLRASGWTSGTATVHINATTRIGQIPIDGNGNIGVRVVDTAPPAGVPQVIVSADTPLVVGIHDTEYIIPNGQTFFLQQIVAGNDDPTKGCSVEVYYDDGTTEHLVNRAYRAGVTLAIPFPDISVTRNGTQMVGDGSTKKIIVRRLKATGSGDMAIDAQAYGYVK